jgi:hypothetical protein
MGIFWQQIIVFAAVCLAVGYLVVYYIRRKRNKATCTNCPNLKVFQNQHQLKARPQVTSNYKNT